MNNLTSLVHIKGDWMNIHQNSHSCDTFGAPTELLQLAVAQSDANSHSAPPCSDLKLLPIGFEMVVIIISCVQISHNENESLPEWLHFIQVAQNGAEHHMQTNSQLHLSDISEQAAVGALEQPFFLKGCNCLLQLNWTKLY